MSLVINLACESFPNLPLEDAFNLLKTNWFFDANWCKIGSSCTRYRFYKLFRFINPVLIRNEH